MTLSTTPEPGYRETYPFIEELRNAHPHEWIAVGDLEIDARSEITAARVVATGATPADLDRALIRTPIETGAIVPPKSFLTLHDEMFGVPRYKAKRIRYREFVAGLQSPLLRAHLAAIVVARGRYFTSHPHSFPWAVLNRLVRHLGGVDGFESVLLRLGADNENVVTGHVQELLRAYSLGAHRSKPLAAIAKVVNVPGLGKTDIDVLTQDGLWVESKRVRGVMSLTRKDLKVKLDKMAEAIRTHAVISLSTRTVTITAAHIANVGRFAPSVHAYARNLGITVQENSVYAFAPW